MIDSNMIELIESECRIRKIQTLCRQIRKRFRVDSNNDMLKVWKLISTLYVFDYIDFCQMLIRPIESIKFNNDYDIWHKVCELICLNSRIYRYKNMMDDSKLCLQIIMAKEIEGKNLWSAQKEGTYDIDHHIRIAVENQQLYSINSTQDIIYLKTLKMMHLIRYIELPDFPIDKNDANNEIIILKNELYSMIK